MPNESTGALHPETGVRVRLERLRSGEEGAEYAASVFTPKERYDAHVQCDRDKKITIEGALEPAHLELVRALMKTIAKSAPPWPAKLLRWRDR